MKYSGNVEMKFKVDVRKFKAFTTYDVKVSHKKKINESQFDTPPWHRPFENQ